MIKTNLSKLTVGGVQVSIAYTSGELDHPHNFGAYGGVKHSRYNEVVMTEFDKFYKAKKKDKLSGADMKEFADLIKSGKGANGKPNKELKAFNDEILASRQRYIMQNPKLRGDKIPRDLKYLMKSGKDLRTNSRFAKYLSSIAAVGVISNSLSKVANATEVMQSNELKLGAEALARGEFTRADKYFVGGSNENGVGGFAAELNDKIGLTYGLAFSKHYYEAMSILHQEADRIATELRQCKDED